MIILGIETSCDECSAAVVRDGHEILSNVIATQIELHKPYQGVVPELASRLHTEWIQQVVEAAIRQAGIEKTDLDAVAVTSRPAGRPRTAGPDERCVRPAPARTARRGAPVRRRAAAPRPPRPDAARCAGRWPCRAWRR